MEPGCAGTGETVTDNVRGALLPQLLLATTEMLPFVPPVVTVIEVEVDDPVHPDGKPHV